ncbi:MAG: DUF1800 domain-containing protein [Bacteroidota bacterium]
MLKKYTGEWSFEQAAHLLRRTTFGATFKEINDTIEQGMEATVRQLVRTRSMPDLPVNYDYEDDPNVPINSQWTRAPHIDFRSNNARRRSLYGWTLMQMSHDRMSIREKMVLFWQSHFVIETDIVRDAKFLYQYVSLFRSQALGNFKSLVEHVTISPSMLRYLNGRDNTESAPNENYARELLELFTLGKGELAGPGDYTTFTEDDVIAMAKVLTGWRDRYYYRKEIESTPESFFRFNQHDRSGKQLSHRFDNQVIANNNADEYKDLIAIIFKHPQASRFICRRLYRWFVHFDITDQIEREVIEPMATILRENDFKIKPVIENLLQSEHFYQQNNIGAMVKSPVDFVMFSLNQLEISFPENNLYRKYQLRFKLYQEMEDMQMEIFNPPNVAGWKAYYQKPLYYQSWISSATLPLRMNYTNKLAQQGLRFAGYDIKVDALKFVEKLSDPYDPNILVSDLAKLLFPHPISDEQKDTLKEILIPGLPDFEWTVEYGNYRNDPSDENLKASVEQKLRDLLQRMMSMPEYYLQ